MSYGQDVPAGMDEFHCTENKPKGSCPNGDHQDLPHQMRAFCIFAVAAIEIAFMRRMLIVGNFDSGSLFTSVRYHPFNSRNFLHVHLMSLVENQIRQVE